jgi:hypothetical protein
VTLVEVKWASKPLSQNWPMDKRARFCSFGKIRAHRAARGSCGSGRRAVWVAWMRSPLGMATKMPLVRGCRSVQVGAGAL